MKKGWKWVIGIVIGLVVLAILVGLGFLVVGGFHTLRMANGYSRGWSPQGPGMMPYNSFGNHLRGPGMMVRGGMMPFAGLIGGLVCLGVLALLVLGIIWLVRFPRKPTQVNSPAAAPAAAATPAPTMDICKKCGKPIQADWKNCPYCGKKV